MGQPNIPAATAQDVLRPLSENRRLARLVSVMAEEITRLNEDNVQLHAAIKIYRELARRPWQAQRP